MPKIVDVAVPVGVRKTFRYEVPSRLEPSVAPGIRVLVPFGRKLLTGYVVGVPEDFQDESLRLKPVRELVDSTPIIPPDLVDLALWIADYYFTPPGEVFRKLFPTGSEIVGTRRIALSERTAAWLSGGLYPPGTGPRENTLLRTLAESGPLSEEELLRRSGLAAASQELQALVARGLVLSEDVISRPKTGAKENLGIRRVRAPEQLSADLPSSQHKLYSILDSCPQALQAALRNAGASLSVARALERKGLVAIEPFAIERVPGDLSAGKVGIRHVLTPGQESALASLTEMLLRNRAERCLLHGVTGSGKTEVYLRLIEEALRKGGTALLLVPEIGLTPLLTRLVSARFPGLVSLLHSGLSAGERFDQWHRIRAGGTPVVVGTRSAVFAPLRNLRLIVVDEEQDGSYKQDESPCYHAREVAWQRMLRTGGLLVLGSATPSIETFHDAKQARMSYLRLSERIESRPLPEIAIIDMALEFKRCGKANVISEALRDELEDRLTRREQSMLLLNRRGYSRLLLCRSCGHVYACSECSISMTYHQEDHRLRCHYCGAEKEPPAHCIGCGGKYLYFVGVGTEQLEAILRAMFPSARIARVDRDTTRRRGSIGKVLSDFADRKLDILVGTQMLAKGHDFPSLTLVGVVAADIGLRLPDFRAAERTFQLLTQVAGRAGRGATPGRVVVQSFYPGHYALRFVETHDYDGFYHHELEFRSLMAYPPYRRLVKFLVSDPDQAKAVRMADQLAGSLKSTASRIDPRTRPLVLGPAEAPIAKIRGKYRYQVLIKSPGATTPSDVMRQAFALMEETKTGLKKVQIDVDPLSLL